MKNSTHICHQKFQNLNASTQAICFLKEQSMSIPNKGALGCPLVQPQPRHRDGGVRHRHTGITTTMNEYQDHQVIPKQVFTLLEISPV